MYGKSGTHYRKTVTVAYFIILSGNLFDREIYKPLQIIFVFGLELHEKILIFHININK